jgi:hypothetical protein
MSFLNLPVAGRHPVFQLGVCHHHKLTRLCGVWKRTSALRRYVLTMILLDMLLGCAHRDTGLLTGSLSVCSLPSGLGVLLSQRCAEIISKKHLLREEEQPGRRAL